MMVGHGVMICKFRYSRSRNMNWALDRHGGGWRSLSPPTSFRSWAPTHIYRGLRRGRRGKGWFGFSPPESLGLSWWRLRGEQGRKTGCTAMPAWTVAPGHPEDLLWQPGSRIPSLPWRKGSEGGWSRHPSSGQLLAAAER